MNGVSTNGTQIVAWVFYGWWDRVGPCSVDYRWVHL